MTVDTKTEAEIMTAIGEYAQAVRSGDYQRLASLFAPDSDVVAIGPALGERWVGPHAIAASFERDIKNFPESDIEFNWISISGCGGVVWIASECKSHVRIDNKVLRLEGRFTAVYERRGTRWLILQSHYSFPSVL